MKMTFAAAALAAWGSIATAAGAATYTVYNSTQLDQAVGKARGGDTIKVAPGNYGAYEFKNVNRKQKAEMCIMEIKQNTYGYLEVL